MAGLARNARALALLTGLVFASAASARAQHLASLHVRAFSLQADRDRVHVGESIHVTIVMRVAEQIDICDTTLPDLFGFQVLGDERRVSSTPAGTVCTETVTLSASEAGTRTIGPVTFEAIDANTKRPSRFGTNTIQIRVDPASPAPASLGGDILRPLFWLALLSLGIIVFLRVRKPRLGTVRRIEAEPAGVPAEADPMPSEGARWRALVEALAEQPTRENVVAVRALLRQRVGAREDETFGDILARGVTREQPELLEAMRAVERAAFIDEVNLYSATREAVAALERYSRSLPA